MSTDPETTIHKKLSHLTSVQIDDLIDRYYHGSETVSELIRVFQIDVPPIKLNRLFPPRIYADSYCQYCPSQNLISWRGSRSGYSRSHEDRYCPKCGHSVEGYCNCDYCAYERQREKSRKEKKEAEIETRKREIIIKTFASRDIGYPAANEIGFRDALYIMSIVSHSDSENLPYIDPYSPKRSGLAPTYEYTNEIVCHLHAKGFVNISPDCSLDAFQFDDEFTKLEKCYAELASWQLLPNITGEKKTNYLKYIELVVKKQKWSDKWNFAADREWNRIAKYECFENFRHLLAERGFRIEKFEDKTHRVFEDLMRTYSVSQIFNLTWQAVRDATDYCVKKGLSGSHAKNIFIRIIQRKAERCIDQKWELKHSHRDYGLPRSVVSSMFFDVFLELGDETFQAVTPQIEW